ncbi:MAG TPA: SDR family NAD-dependent epimerase/dehydratase [Candidatus Marinimicrobia bacterium]|nr:SDR family NAD-dependent epimerase/dehydratase [Candidatus Neomarinimicrobiota bacterium]
MKILITGNMGYIGPVVMQHLRIAFPEASLIGFDTAYYGTSITTNTVLPERCLDAQYYGDIRHFPKGLLKDVDGIIHLAAISNDPIGNAFEEVTNDINYQSTVKLATEAKEAGVKSFVFSSSCSIYGAAADEARDENSPLNPLTAYANSKVNSERDLEQLAADDFRITSLRFSTACGMSERLRLDLVLNDFVACAITSKKLTVLSDGTPWRPLINITDMARAMEWAISRPVNDGGPFLAVNIGSDNWNYQVRDLAEAVARIIPGVNVSINQDAPEDNRSYKVNFNLFKHLAPHHQPQVNLKLSIEELRDGLTALGFNDPDFRHSRFMRLVHLTNLRKKGYLNSNLEWTWPSIPTP